MEPGTVGQRSISFNFRAIAGRPAPLIFARATSTDSAPAITRPADEVVSPAAISAAVAARCEQFNRLAAVWLGKAANTDGSAHLWKAMRRGRQMLFGTPLGHRRG